jgi:hypothetical protein
MTLARRGTRVVVALLPCRAGGQVRQQRLDTCGTDANDQVVAANRDVANTRRRSEAEGTVNTVVRTVAVSSLRRTVTGRSVRARTGRRKVNAWLSRRYGSMIRSSTRPVRERDSAYRHAWQVVPERLSPDARRTAWRSPPCRIACSSSWRRWRGDVQDVLGHESEGGPDSRERDSQAATANLMAKHSLAS